MLKSGIETGCLTKVSGESKYPETIVSECYVPSAIKRVISAPIIDQNNLERVRQRL
jgi:hypothetical protein